MVAAVATAIAALVSCGPLEPEPQARPQPPTPAPPQQHAPAPSDEVAPELPNRAQTLDASANELRTLAIAHLDHTPIATLDAQVVRSVQRALETAESSDSVQLTPPRWALVVLLGLEGRQRPLVAHPIGEQTLRFNAIDPWSARFADEAGRVDGRASEIDVGPELFSAIEAALGPGAEQPKEYRMRPGAVDLSKYEKTP